MITYFVVQAYSRQPRGSITADDPQQVPSAAQAIRSAQRLADLKTGVIAFSRTGDPASGEWKNAVILFEAGAVPAEAFDVAAAS